ncbi:Dfp1/Him1, central region-domain-containing protein [Emericellopsis atlantica]|uniref:Dfp1/Him1, central region-domain-containing protein n=1 Tax=Emericellopsis atlantica TaxID=2614577 RepID=A0A9P8CS66_9HYPO|nr:Dfp1/Him1, central region-domain-containing protein [Emericellopsis atlantica]KAG9256905.1 Dfp1/Him1, central region-domain-containing protein [Emericellopsis atlantica]
MATISVSPTPAIAAMASRRGPLTNNPNVANSPLRVAPAGFAKPKRPYAVLQREEPYGQAPPSKKQAVEQRVARSPSKLPRAQALPQRGSTTATTSRPVTKERTQKPAASAKVSLQDEREKDAWKKHYRAKFPKMVFYFESIPEDIRAKLTKRITYLGARQEPFFSIDVTHVITTRAIPTEQPETQPEPEVAPQDEPALAEQPQTINPSLLDRSSARRKLLLEFRSAPSRSHASADPTKPHKPTRNSDVLHKAKDMGKKIWSLEKFWAMVSLLCEAEKPKFDYRGSGTYSNPVPRAAGESAHASLNQMLRNERINGPSDRDVSALSKDLTYFKGPHIYVFDMEERHKPIMVREYAKVSNKMDGDWPQFRSVGSGRCPFVEEDPEEKERQKRREQRQLQQEKDDARAAAAKQAEASKAQAQAALPKPVIGKRTLGEMEDGHNKVRAPATSTINPAKAALSKQGSQNAFVSRNEGGRLVHGEPVASGVQPSNITSAIRSQMISSQAGITGIKAGTSKELHGLQRQVLQKTGAVSQETSSRRPVDNSVEGRSSRSVPSLSRKTSHNGSIPEAHKATDSRDKRSQSQAMKSKKDMKPGYCENCQEKFRDFDEHILSRKHRRFAENPSNWVELDDLLAELTRQPKEFMSSPGYDL